MSAVAQNWAVGLEKSRLILTVCLQYTEMSLPRQREWQAMILSARGSLMNHILFMYFFLFSSYLPQNGEQEKKNKAKPKHQITGSKMRPYGFSLLFFYLGQKTEIYLHVKVSPSQEQQLFNPYNKCDKKQTHTLHVCKCLINNNKHFNKKFAYIRPGSNCISVHSE